MEIKQIKNYSFAKCGIKMNKYDKSKEERERVRED